MIRAVITGSGSALPRTCVTNDELAARVDTSDDWIVARTGIRQRYFAGEGETTSTLATAAAGAALADAGIAAADIDLIVLGTHGRGGLSRLLMGSVAEAVVRRAECPVLTFKHNRVGAATR